MIRTLTTMLVALVALTFTAPSHAQDMLYKKSKMLNREGKEEKVEMVFGRDVLTIHRKGHPEEVWATIGYDSISALTYERAKSMRLKTALFISPIALFSKGKKHWLAIEYTHPDTGGAAVTLVLDKKEYRAILADVSARSPVELVRTETK